MAESYNVLLGEGKLPLLQTPPLKGEMRAALAGEPEGGEGKAVLFMPFFWIKAYSCGSW